MWVISGVYIWAYWFCLSSRSCCCSVWVIFVCFWLLYCVCVCSFCFYFADVFSSTMWSDLWAAVTQGYGALHTLASSLPDVTLASRAPSTSSKYLSSFNTWRSWAREHGLTVFPASPFHLAIYWRHLRAAPRKYQLDEEIVKKWPGLKLSQNKALWALVTKSLV